jgi:hypothetical protein
MCHVAGKEIFIEQTPWHGIYLDTLKSLFPNMKVVHIIRDGRDVALSYARTPWWSKDVMANLERWEQEVNIAHSFCKENPESCIELRYEDLVMHPEATLTKILRFLSLNFEEQLLDPDKLFDYLPLFKGDSLSVQSEQFLKWGQEKRNVFFPESIYGWRKKQDIDFSVLPEMVTKTLKRFGYDA